ncbi:HK97 family phage prohead protease [Gottfriedia sp. NPDC056225]|uniref:HK97 family phage prohead protease n=1 Tax=Gottfriedia sp. NPDC056225 TaxID=3345751 RepID=UPI0035E21C0E
MENKEKRSLTLAPEIREKNSEDESSKIVGYAVKWGQRSNTIGYYYKFEERFEKGAFFDAINGDVIAAWNHDWNEILGRSTSGTLLLEEDDIGLRYEITMPLWADKYVETVQRGDVSGSSFTFIPEVEEWDETNEVALRTIKKAKLYEVSPVVFPAYPQSEAGVRSMEDVFETFQRSRNPSNDDIAKKIDLMRKKLSLSEKL